MEHTLEKRKRLAEEDNPETEQDDVMVIKKCWRGTMARLKVIKMREEEMIFLGITRKEVNE